MVVTQSDEIHAYETFQVNLEGRVAYPFPLTLFTASTLLRTCSFS